MKKEALLAIVIGIIVGLGITYGIYQIRQRFAPAPVQEVLTENTATISPVPAATEKLFITSPQNESVVSDKEITLSGTTQSSEMVVVVVNEQEYVTQADNIGAFAVKISLTSGSNIIQVTSLDSTGATNVKDLIIILDPETTVASEATASASTGTPRPSATPKTTP